MQKLIFSDMESSELVQRLQTQLLDLRTENCEVKEREKYILKQYKTLEAKFEESEKQLKIESRKNKALSFLPGQSGLKLIIDNSLKH